MRLLSCLLACVLVVGALSAAVRKEEKIRKFKEQLKRFRGNQTEDDLEYIREKLKKRGERLKANIHVSKEQRQNLTTRLEKIGRAKFGERHNRTPEWINEDKGISEYLFEGDIILTKEQADELDEDDEEGRQKRQAYTGPWYPYNIWQKPIPYKFASNLTADAISIITLGIQFWEANTCISFVHNGAGNDLIHFFKGSGCYSYIGRITGEQGISIGTGCEYIRQVTHEIGHALGFFHTHSRHDRDDYVTINLDNVESSVTSAFRKETEERNYNYGQEYEYGSVMQYDAFAFAKDGSIPTIVPFDTEYFYTMGSGREPSFYDVWMMNKHYNCLSVCDSYNTVCYNGGYKDIKDCTKCKCPGGYGGNDCSERQPGCGETLTATTTYQNYTSLQLGTNTRQSLYDECNYWITAPMGKAVEVILDRVTSYCTEGCFWGGVEFKSGADQMATGYRYCCSSVHNGKVMTSVGNILPIILYSCYARSAFIIRYRYIDSNIETTPTTTKATTTPTTTEATTTPTTTKATTTPTTTKTTTIPTTTKATTTPTTTEATTTLTTTEATTTPTTTESTTTPTTTKATTTTTATKATTTPTTTKATTTPTTTKATTTPTTTKATTTPTTAKATTTPTTTTATTTPTTAKATTTPTTTKATTPTTTEATTTPTTTKATITPTTTKAATTTASKCSLSTLTDLIKLQGSTCQLMSVVSQACGTLYPTCTASRKFDATALANRLYSMALSKTDAQMDVITKLKQCNYMLTQFCTTVEKKAWLHAIPIGEYGTILDFINCVNTL